MRVFSYGFRQVLQWLRTLVICSLLCLILGWSLPSQAANRISPRLEKQVLDIIREHPEVILESLQRYQQEQQQRLQQARQAFLQELQTNPQALIGQSPTTGSTEFQVVLIEFSDFQCPFCAKAHETLKQFMAKHQEQVTLVYKHFPLKSIHPQAVSAAEAAWAAQQQGKFWKYEDALFTNQQQLGEELYLDVAKKLNLDLEKFQRDRTLASAAIEKDVQLAENLGLSGTPFFIMNGATFSGSVELSDLEDVFNRVSGIN